MNVIRIKVVYGTESSFKPGYLLYNVKSTTRLSGIMGPLNDRIRHIDMTAGGLIHKDRQLDLTKTIGDYKIKDGDELFATI